MAPRRQRPVDALAAAAAAWQERVIVPHCAVCREPCCRLNTVVLDLDWARVQALYRIETPKRAFDAALAGGNGPSQLRKQGDLYYAHVLPCPAYDEAAHRCTVYGSALKPPSCTDFPVYVDGEGVTADRRCEAVDVAALQAHLERATGMRLRQEPDDDFPELVTLVPLQSRDRERSSE